ncbi:MAG: MTH1187 family thiamine-binding protein [Proteobacteria bacterium]|nr:MTH1187 family thiamine-binding protein [Pseudomonadota bacterium]MBU1648187.1 MTH1187 family thiamine-binding protein [Pseudomonadota bacterium]
MALLQLTIIPIGTSTPNLGNYVLAIQKRLTDMGATFTLNDMGTLIEGEATELLKLVIALYESPFAEGAVRVITQITIDDRRDKKVNIGDKTQSILSRYVSQEANSHD